MSENGKISIKTKIDNAAGAYIVTKDDGLDYTFNGKTRHLKMGTKVVPADHTEEEYCQNLHFSGSMARQ